VRTSFPCQAFLKQFHVIDRIPKKKNSFVREKKTANILIVDGQPCVRELLSKEMAHEAIWFRVLVLPNQSWNI
jgi:hypothetical protein